MTPTIDPETLIALMGAPIDAPAVADFRSQFEHCREHQTSSETMWLFDRDGIELGFRTSNQNRLESISLYGAGVESGVRKYKSPLPAVRFRMLSEAVEVVLKPRIHRDRWATDFYVLGQLVVRAAYDYDDKLNQFTLWLPEAAAELDARIKEDRPVATPGLSNGYSDLVAMLGKPESDPELVAFREQFDHCHERFDSGANLWCFLETSGRGSGFYLAFDRLEFVAPEDVPKQLAMIVIHEAGQEPAHSQLANSLPEPLRFDQSRATLRESLGAPVRSHEHDDFFYIDGHTMSVSYFPQSKRPDSICIYHSDVAEQIGLSTPM